MDSGIESTESSNGSVYDNQGDQHSNTIDPSNQNQIYEEKFSRTHMDKIICDDKFCASSKSEPHLKIDRPRFFDPGFEQTRIDPRSYEMNLKKIITEQYFDLSNSLKKKFDAKVVSVEAPQQSSKDNLPLPEGCKLKINFPNHGPLNLNIPPAKSSIPLGEVNSTGDRLSDNYYGPLAVLPYESRELQRKFKHYRHRIKQLKDLSYGKPKEKKLRIAASLNNTDLVSSLIDEGVNPNCVDGRRRTPLHIAASKGYTDIVKILLQNGANPNQKDIIGNTPLHLAACTSHIETVTLLLKAGTDAKETDNSGFSPLHLANSRLRLMQKDMNPSSTELKGQVLQIIEMMEAFMKRSGNIEDAETLASLTNKLSLTDYSESGEDEFKLLLNNLQDLTLNKTKVD